MAPTANLRRRRYAHTDPTKITHTKGNEEDEIAQKATMKPKYMTGNNGRQDKQLKSSQFFDPATASFLSQIPLTLRHSMWLGPLTDEMRLVDDTMQRAKGACINPGTKSCNLSAVCGNTLAQFVARPTRDPRNLSIISQ